ncbi:MAG: D-alanyl-D-alanine carboxypeptidase family protein [Eubacteriales bacterium]|nr:D-alanyl-D-alanine carboxypeptidase family protein [Eubacteriales bacterium]
MNKFFKRITSMVLALTTLTLSVLCILDMPVMANDTPADAEWPSAPEIASQSAILIDADTGAILYERNAHDKCYPASTTKILTGLLTIENCSMNETVTFSQKAANSVNPIEDANLGTLAGEQYTVEQALYGLLLYSANEIAYGLAEHVSQNLSSFTDLMNERAAELGALNTHFSNASGLYSPDHYTTAYDMARIARACYNNATFVNIDSTYTYYTIPETNMSSAKRTFQHRHKMLKNREYYYEYCKGGKTGFTDESQYTLVTFAEKDGMRLICVLFKCPDENTRFTDTRTLFDWGFANFEKVTSSGSQTSSLFSSSNYYTSSVFSKHKINFNLDATYITIPNNGDTGAITMEVDKNYSSANSNGNLTSQINFIYKDNIVGASSLVISSDSTQHAGSNLPYNENDNNLSALSPKACLKINVWLLAAAGIIILLIIYIVSGIRQAKRRNMRMRSRRRF